MPDACIVESDAELRMPAVIFRCRLSGQDDDSTLALTTSSQSLTMLCNCGRRPTSLNSLVLLANRLSRTRDCSTRQALTGSAKPFRVCSPYSVNSNAPAVASYVR